jgi:hypothetical protein
MSTANNSKFNPILAVLAIATVWLIALAAWITHVVVCIKSASWILLAFGCIVAPVGVVHGWGIWLGVF